MTAGMSKKDFPEAKVIWKYEIPMTKYFDIMMPQGSTILTVQTQNNRPVLWAMVDPNASIIAKHFVMFGTGYWFKEGDLDGLWRYIGTFQLDDGVHVEHLFEKI